MNPKNYTDVELQNAREYAASIDVSVLESLTKKAPRPIPQDYIDQRVKLISDIRSGLLDGNFTIYQRMEYFLTGTSTPFLP